jgi:hypothetical protein
MMLPFSAIIMTASGRDSICSLMVGSGAIDGSLGDAVLKQKTCRGMHGPRVGKQGNIQCVVTQGVVTVSFNRALFIKRQ